MKFTSDLLDKAARAKVDKSNTSAWTRHQGKQPGADRGSDAAGSPMRLEKTMLSKTLAEAKERAIHCLRSGIDSLARQSEWSEKGAYHARAQASLATILDAGLITSDEFMALGNEIGVTNGKAAEQARQFDPK